MGIAIIEHMDQLYDWESDTYEVLLLRQSMYDEVDVVNWQYVSDLPGGAEAEAPGYSRYVLTDLAKFIDFDYTPGVNVVWYSNGGNPIYFGTPSAGEVYDAILMYKLVNDDTDSLVLSFHKMPPTEGDGTDFYVSPPDAFIAARTTVTAGSV